MYHINKYIVRPAAMLAFLSSASFLSAAVNVSLSTTAPDGGDVYFSQDNPASASGLNVYYNTTQNYHVGQSFSTSGVDDPLSLSSVTFGLVAKTSQGGNRDYTNAQGKAFTVSVYQFAASGQVGNLANATSVVTQQSGVLPTTISLSADSYMKLAFTEPVILAPNAYYSVIFSFVDQTSTGSSVTGLFMKTIGSIPNETDSIRLLRNGETTFSTQATNGFVFFAEASPIPEPAAFAVLAGLMAIGFAAARRPRRGA